MARAGTCEDNPTTCPACGGSDLESVGAQVYRCAKCGFLSGDGVVAQRRRQRAEALTQRSAEERIALAKGALREAQSALLAAQALLADAASRSRWEVLGFSLDRGRTKQSSFGAAVRTLRNAEQLANEAFELLAADTWSESLDLDTSPLLMELDAAWISDGRAANVAIHVRIEQARKRAASLLERVESSLASVDGRAHR